MRTCWPRPLLHDARGTNVIGATRSGTTTGGSWQSQPFGTAQRWELNAGIALPSPVIERLATDGWIFSFACWVGIPGVVPDAAPDSTGTNARVANLPSHDIAEGRDLSKQCHVVTTVV
jgi:hypothetical protein